MVSLPYMDPGFSKKNHGSYPNPDNFEKNPRITCAHTVLSMPPMILAYTIDVGLGRLKFVAQRMAERKKEIILTSTKLKIAYGTDCFFICLMYLALFQ